MVLQVVIVAAIVAKTVLVGQPYYTVTRARLKSYKVARLSKLYLIWRSELVINQAFRCLYREI